MPQMVLMSVVFPAPFGPSRAKISPRRISRSMFLSAWRPDAKVLERFDTEMIACREVELMPAKRRILPRADRWPVPLPCRARHRKALGYKLRRGPSTNVDRIFARIY